MYCEWLKKRIKFLPWVERFFYTRCPKGTLKFLNIYKFSILTDPIWFFNMNFLTLIVDNDHLDEATFEKLVDIYSV